MDVRCPVITVTVVCLLARRVVFFLSKSKRTRNDSDLLTLTAEHARVLRFFFLFVCKNEFSTQSFPVENIV